MRIERANFQGVQGVRDGEYPFASQGPTIVTGPPGSGKTRFLASLMAAKERVGAYRLDHAFGRMVDNTHNFARISIDWSLDEAERVDLDANVASESTFGADVDADENDLGLEELLTSFSADRTSIVFYLPAQRAFATGERSYEEYALRESAPDTSAEKLSWVASALRDAARAEGNASDIERFRRNLQRFGLSLHFHSMERIGGRETLVFASDGELRLGVEELSFVEGQAVLLAGFFTFTRLEKSIILLDSPELGAAPEAQPRFLQAVIELAGSNQLVVASSAIHVAASTGAHVITLSPRRIQ